MASASRTHACTPTRTPTPHASCPAYALLRLQLLRLEHAAWTHERSPPLLHVELKDFGAAPPRSRVHAVVRGRGCSSRRLDGGADGPAVEVARDPVAGCQPISRQGRCGHEVAAWRQHAIWARARACWGGSARTWSPRSLSRGRERRGLQRLDVLRVGVCPALLLVLWREHCPAPRSRSGARSRQIGISGCSTSWRGG